MKAFSLILLIGAVLISVIAPSTSMAQKATIALKLVHRQQPFPPTQNSAHAVDQDVADRISVDLY